MKRLIFPLLALIVGIGLFQYFSSNDHIAEQTPTGGLRPVGPAVESTTDPVSILPVGRGSNPVFTVLSPTGEVRYVFRSERWEPVEDTLVVQRPDIEVHSPDGQIMYVTADHGEIEMASMSTSRANLKYDPRRGWIRGNVHVIVDRTSKEWRARNPQRAARDAHPERLIRIWLGEEARFDLEQQHLIADGVIRMQQGEEVDIEANGGPESLVIRWDQKSATTGAATGDTKGSTRLELITFQHGGRMRVLRGGGLVDLPMPGSEREQSGESAVRDDSPAEVENTSQADRHSSAIEVMKPRAVPDLSTREAAEQVQRSANRPIRIGEQATDAASQPISDLTGMDSLVASSQPSSSDRAARVDTYAAVFERNVHVQRRRGLTVTGQLDCPQLELIFDVTKKQRESGGFVGGASSSRPVDEREAPVDVSVPDDTVDEYLVLTWEGELTLRAHTEGGTQSGKRFDAVASGGKVKLRDGTGSASCNEMVFKNETTSVWFAGSLDEPARLVRDSGQEIVAPEIMFDRTAGFGRLSGAGMLKDPGRRNNTALPTALRDDGVRVARIGEGGRAVEIRWTDRVEMDLQTIERSRVSADGRPVTGKRDYIRTAVFKGDVHILQGERRMAGREVTVNFGVPFSEKGLADHIVRLEVDGDVMLADAGQVIRSQWLGVDFDEQGRNLPTKAEARGGVSATQNQRRFGAERMTVSFDAVVSSDGRTTRSVMRKLVADDKVTIRDGGQQANRIELDGEHLEVAFSENGDPGDVLVVGPGDRGPAYLRRGDYEVIGHRITVDATEQELSVNGSGVAGFITRYDLDGRAVREPMAVSISFSDGMRLNGAENVGRFLGQVRTVTDSHELRCTQELTLRFADIDSGDPNNVTALRAADEPQLGVVRWMQGRFVAESDPQSASARSRKRPVYLWARGDVVGLSSEFDDLGRARARMRISGPALDVDLRRREMNIAGRGSLAIEDYRLTSTSAQNSTPAGGAPILGSQGTTGPSQTFFYWTNAMSFNMAEALVTFDRSVQMIHRSGDQIFRKEAIAEIFAADMDKFRLGAGRKATLNAEQLIAQFATDRNDSSTTSRRSSSFGIRWNELQQLVAERQVLLQENDRNVSCDSLTLDGARDVMVVKGRPGQEARISEQNEETQRSRLWRGPVLIWNRKTGQVDAPNATITSQ